MSTVIFSDRYLFLVYACICCFKPRFYGGCFCDRFLLEETTLRTSLAFVFPKTCTFISVSSYICGVVFQGLSVSTLIISYKYLFLVFYGRRFLTSICLRKPHLEHHSPSLFPKTCTSISPSSYICGMVFQGLSVSIVIISDR